jgi:gluconate 5-dehydrogenase
MVSNLFDITGLNILITGSSRGLGYILARELGLNGANIIVNGMDTERLNEAVVELQHLGVTAIAARFDVTDEADVESTVQRTIEDFGGIDILINNAGIQIRNPMEDFGEADFDRIIAANLKGPFIVSKIVGRHMIQKRKGKIINICSVQSELGRASITPYAASKGGLKMMTRGMAAEWAKYNIQVNGIGPGYFITDMTKPLAEDEKFNNWLCNRVPAHRWGDPMELVGAAIFLCSEASNYVNGHILYVDGGMLACV